MWSGGMYTIRSLPTGKEENDALRSMARRSGRERRGLTGQDRRPLARALGKALADHILGLPVLRLTQQHVVDLLLGGMLLKQFREYQPDLARLERPAVRSRGRGVAIL